MDHPVQEGAQHGPQRRHHGVDPLGRDGQRHWDLVQLRYHLVHDGVDDDVASFERGLKLVAHKLDDLRPKSLDELPHPFAVAAKPTRAGLDQLPTRGNILEDRGRRAGAGLGCAAFPASEITTVFCVLDCKIGCLTATACDELDEDEETKTGAATLATPPGAHIRGGACGIGYCTRTCGAACGGSTCVSVTCGA
eukprot:CAMPEP_0175333196 /NCGR_PEP_ID=MMETSP0095-20121207/2157_1 /TAXON_ID=311494 /ORGANISM="Alexandrium monilatum, Strain CCMP3105" /LENGTH=193 /DNA_ID=CAMNT_0016630485 /DNA_START=110 /DNA_END=689 /DNA_ORIENTATION=+